MPAKSARREQPLVGKMALLPWQEHLMRPHDYVRVPPRVRHGFTNSGLGGLVFFVITAPADDEAPK